MPFVDAFSDAAEQYAASRPAYPKALFEALASVAPALNTAWDCGTGNGQAAIGLAALFNTVYATDASVEQIAQAEPHARVQYRVAPAEASSLANESIDLVSIAQALHWFELDSFYAEVHRVTRPNAILAAYGYSWFYLTPAIDELTNRWLLQPVRTHWSVNNRILWDGYTTIAFPFEEIAAPRLALHLTWTLEQLFEYYLTWSAPRRKLAAEGDGFVRQARNAFEPEWGDPTQRRHVVMPLTIRLGRLRPRTEPWHTSTSGS